MKLFAKNKPILYNINICQAFFMEEAVMIIALIGESCTGKTTITKELEKKLSFEKFSGKDYLRMAKSPSEAENLFKRYLEEKSVQKEVVLYIISEIEELRFLPEKSLKVRCQAPLETIKERFSVRMHGNMPPQVAAMLEKKYGMFNETEADLSYDTTQKNVNEICDEIIKYMMK